MPQTAGIVRFGFASLALIAVACSSCVDRQPVPKPPTSLRQDSVDTTYRRQSSQDMDHRQASADSDSATHGISEPSERERRQSADGDAASPDLRPGPDTARRAAARDRMEATTKSAAVSVLRNYYDAINAREYARAYSLWSSGGPPGQPSLAEFARGFADTKHVDLRVGTVGPIEGAAGSQYLGISVGISALQRTGRVDKYAGTYTLRRAMVPGGEQRWRIYQATMKRTRS